MDPDMEMTRSTYECWFIRVKQDASLEKADLKLRSFARKLEQELKSIPTVVHIVQTG